MRAKRVALGCARLVLPLETARYATGDARYTFCIGKLQILAGFNENDSVLTGSAGAQQRHFEFWAIRQRHVLRDR